MLKKTYLILKISNVISLILITYLPMFGVILNLIYLMILLLQLNNLLILLIILFISDAEDLKILNFRATDKFKSFIMLQMAVLFWCLKILTF